MPGMSFQLKPHRTDILKGRKEAIDGINEDAGESSSEKHEELQSQISSGSSATDVPDTDLAGNLDDIFEDDENAHDLLDTTDGSEGAYANAFDESPPVTRNLIELNSDALPNGHLLNTNNNINVISTTPSVTTESDMHHNQHTLAHDEDNGNDQDFETQLRDNSLKDQSVSSTWHDEVTDIPHRKELIQQIAQLLQERKQNPTQKWLKELPYKAKKLEDQLYKTAPSLKEYLDKATLKHRLKKVAHAITSQFKSAKEKTTHSNRGNSNRGGERNSDMSFSSLLGTSRSSLGQMPSGSDLSDMERQKAVNQKLQEQIMENIRQQQQIMRSLMNSPHLSNSTLNNAATDPMLMGTMGNQNNQMMGQLGMANQLGGLNSNGLGSMNPSAMNNLNNSMGMNSSMFNANNGGIMSGGMNMGGMNMAAMNMGAMNMGAMNMGGNLMGGVNPGGMNAGGGFNMMGFGTNGLNLANLNASGMNPLLLQQLLQQQQQQQQQMNVGQQLPSTAAQMAMMNLRNSLTGQSNSSGMNASMLMNPSMGSSLGNSMGSSMSSVLPSPSLTGSVSQSSLGINPTMPPPNMNPSSRSSFGGSNSGMNLGISEDGGVTGSSDMNLSPNTFKW